MATISDKQNGKIQKKRTLYIDGLIKYFTDTTKDITIKNCYNYVKENFNNDDFLRTLSSEEREIVALNVEKWKQSLKTIRAFKIFLKNNEINIKKQ